MLDFQHMILWNSNQGPLNKQVLWKPNLKRKRRLSLVQSKLRDLEFCLDKAAKKNMLME